MEKLLWNVITDYVLVFLYKIQNVLKINSFLHCTFHNSSISKENRQGEILFEIIHEYSWNFLFDQLFSDYLYYPYFQDVKTPVWRQAEPDWLGQKWSYALHLGDISRINRRNIVQDGGPWTITPAFFGIDAFSIYKIASRGDQNWWVFNLTKDLLPGFSTLVQCVYFARCTLRQVFIQFA